MPMLVLAGALLWKSRGQPGPGGAVVDAGCDALGLVLALAGQTLRFYTLGWVPEGTSGQNLTIQASTLNTRGPYAWVRNPLYLGNLGIVLGLLCIAHDAWVYLLGLGFFFGEYFFIIRAEENFLREKFGAAFDDFCAKVPRWVPRPPAASEGALRHGQFDWRRALKKEINPISAWVTGAVVLFGWESWARAALSPPVLGVLATALCVVVLSLFLVKAWKKGWLFA